MLEGILRESIGKPVTKGLRRDGYLIANIYGKGLENIHAAFKMNDFIRTVRNKESVAFPVSIAGNEMNLVVQGYESHPVSGNLLHVDLMVAQPGVVTHYHIPVKPVGSPIGLKNKGMLFVAKKRLRVKAAIENIPNFIEINVAPLDLGDSVLVRDLPRIENVTFTDSERVAVLSVIKAK
ncbi:MAG: 50S ribosomal protein L25/general stress protein Ctc [Sulfuricurvum sp.]|jgi:large subunit ribosomal protein L25|uniref:50S ribosomal protein L25/general stress protein Ctc n=1 Tax=Sulfuricurvum sp. TaxID=2025608 RepID=UPI0026107165|nr:50S ribosomal protein L25/general stress protein Ctc [Sulfuricurvum sp.]MDD2829754.1 50S ribosomal protein L25/general stress protein Ctc [Sulfuricurvum sp.]MDD4948494.1 50S ribosomal protein L25/general stress protein Ctc [Sulfuricurvum sp.]